MAITIDNGQAKSSNPLKGFPLVLMAILGVAVGAIIASAVSGASDEGVVQSSPTAPARLSLAVSAPEQSVIYYIVGSTEQAEYINWAENQAANERSGAGPAGPEPIYRVLLVNSPEEADAAMAQIASDMAVEDGRALDYRITDVRNWTLPTHD